MFDFNIPNVSAEPYDSPTAGKVVISPLERGFGTTLGNSLRRVLLYSLAGAAVVYIKINGAVHEFSTLDGVKEGSA